MPVLVRNVRFENTTPPPAGTTPPALLVSDSKAQARLNGEVITSGISFAWALNDIIVVRGGAETGIQFGGWTSSLVLDNKTNLAFTAVSAAGGTSINQSWGRAWVAVATGAGSGAMTATATYSGGANNLQVWLQVEHWRYSAGVGNTVAAAYTGTTPTQALTASESSSVSTGWVDWNADPAGSTGETNTGTLTELEDFNISGAMTIAAWVWEGVTAGADNWGSTSGTGRLLTFPGTVEVLGLPTELNRTLLFSGDINSTSAGGHADLAAANTAIGTVTAGAMLIVAQFGTMFQNVGNPIWAVPTQSAGTATIGTPVEIDTVFPVGGNNFAATRLTVWQIPVTVGGTLTLQTDENLTGAGTSGSWGWGLIVEEVTGQDPTTPVVGDVARSWSNDLGGGLNQAAADSTLGATPTTDDLLYAFGSWDVDTGTNSVAAGASWTEIAQVAPASVYTMASGNTKDNTTSTNVVWPVETSTGDSYSFAGIAFIVKKAP